AYIRVADYGAGIPEEDMKRIFDAFTRLGERQGEVSGSGLGLYITRGIVAAHDGELSVRNRTGAERAGGAIFVISLPLQHGKAPAPTCPPPARRRCPPCDRRWPRAGAPRAAGQDALLAGDLLA